MSDLWVWISVGDNRTCPDCADRNGTYLTYNEWQNSGFPGEGSTICGGNCRCIVWREDVFSRVSGVEITTFTDPFGNIRLTDSTLRRAGFMPPIRPLTASTQAQMSDMGLDSLLDMDATDLQEYLAEFMSSERPGVEYSLMSVQALLDLVASL